METEQKPVTCHRRSQKLLFHPNLLVIFTSSSLASNFTFINLRGFLQASTTFVFFALLALTFERFELSTSNIVSGGYVVKA